MTTTLPTRNPKNLFRNRPKIRNRTATKKFRNKLRNRKSGKVWPILSSSRTTSPAAGSCSRTTSTVSPKTRRSRFRMTPEKCRKSIPRKRTLRWGPDFRAKIRSRNIIRPLWIRWADAAADALDASAAIAGDASCLDFKIDPRTG